MNTPRDNWPLADRIAYLAGRIHGASEMLNHPIASPSLLRDADELEMIAAHVRHYIGNTRAPLALTPSDS